MEISYIAKRLQELVIERGVSQTDLAEQTGIDRSQISRYLSGAVQPSTATLKKLASYFGVAPISLISGSDPTKPRAESAPIFIGPHLYERLSQTAERNGLSIDEEVALRLERSLEPQVVAGAGNIAAPDAGRPALLSQGEREEIARSVSTAVIGQLSQWTTLHDRDKANLLLQKAPFEDADSAEMRREDLKALVERYIKAANGDQIEGMAALIEHVLREADTLKPGGWLALIMRMKELSG